MDGYLAMGIAACSVEWWSTIQRCINLDLGVWIVFFGWDGFLCTFRMVLADVVWQSIFGVVWRGLGGPGEPLCSLWVPLGDFRELSGHLWCSQAPLWEVLGAPWVHFRGHLVSVWVPQASKMRTLRLQASIEKPMRTLFVFIDF